MKKLNASELEWLRGQLKHGDIRRIAKISGYSTYTVSKFFNGKTNHEDILDVAMKLILNRSKIYLRFQKFSEELKKTNEGM